MSAIINESAPYGARDEDNFLEELKALSHHHIDGCLEFSRIWQEWRDALRVEDIPYLHVGIFKHIDMKTEQPGIRHERTLKSSATTSGISSRIALDRKSSALQSMSSLAILKDFVGDENRPLIVLDSSRSLRARKEMSARVAAAMSLGPLATEMHFLLDDPEDISTIKWDVLAEVLAKNASVLMYGFTWVLWTAIGGNDVPANVREAMKNCRIHFVHSGGWKKLESISVSRESFDTSLLKLAGPASGVIDFYGLVEQVGVIYPLCSEGYRHVPRWADVIVRDPYTLEPLVGQAGQLQLLNSISFGAPYYSVLTEDMGRIVDGPCPCGRSGRRFELLGRVPRAEVRGCANV